MNKFYTGNIRPKENTIFVFGSNTEGRHGKGAAKVAMSDFGAKYGQSFGMQGNSFAIITKDLKKAKYTDKPTIDREFIIGQIKMLYSYAKSSLINNRKNFMVAYRTKENEKSLCGYTGGELASMFVEAGKIPKNIIFSKEWSEFNIFKNE